MTSLSCLFGILATNRKVSIYFDILQDVEIDFALEYAFLVSEDERV